MRLFKNDFGIRKLTRRGRPMLVIRRDDQGAGLFAHFAANLGWMRWAIEKRGLLPYVDMRRVPNAFNRGAVLPFNPWECFFRQCSDCSEADFLQASRVYETPTTGMVPDWPRCDPSLMQEGNPEMLAWRRFVQENLRVTPEMLALADNRQRELFGNDDRILGCLFRGTDYVRMKPKWHPIQPTVEQAIADAREMCRRFDLHKVFLATEDASIVEAFRAAFGARLVTNQTQMPNYASGFLMSSGAMGDGESTLAMNRQYMVSVLLLARSRFFLAGCASGAVGALLLSPGYEHCHVYNLGVYQ